MSDWLTIEELAKHEGLTVESARKRAQRGQYERKKDGRRTLYRIFTAEQIEAAAEEKEEVSAQAAFLAAKSKKMQLDAERAALKLNREKMILYDEIFRDQNACLMAFCSIVRDGVMQMFTPEQGEQYNKLLSDATAQYAQTRKELREQYAEEIKSDPSLFEGYAEYEIKKHQERKKAEEERISKRKNEHKTLETLRTEGLHKIFSNEYFCECYTEIQSKSNLTDKATAALLAEYRERYDKLAAHFTLAAEKIKNEDGLSELIKEYTQKRNALTADTLKKGE